MRDRHREAGVPPEELDPDSAVVGAEAERLDGLAREHGRDDGMPYGYQQPPHEAWRAVRRGMRRYVGEVR